GVHSHHAPSHPLVIHVLHLRPTSRVAHSAARNLILSFAAASVAACASAPKSASSVAMAPGTGVVTGGESSKAAIATADEAAGRFSPADVEFMQGMIPHHAQAVIMGRWAATHGARTDVKILCERIVVAQSDEIRSMRRWLGEHNQEVPDSMSTRHKMKMGDMVHEIMMPGMLTDEQMAALDKARGTEFDRLFLVGMIGHHEGALTMVHELFSHANAASDDVVFRFATDVEADQSLELHKMRLMLESLGN
ncbi:MAG: DUF305 domain-containing protein, partial [Gemmatimonas sp.]